MRKEFSFFNFPPLILSRIEKTQKILALIRALLQEKLKPSLELGLA